MVGIISDTGNVRKNNQDYTGYVEDDRKSLYIIADGMGGHNAGEVASKIAVETMLEFINSLDYFDELEKTLNDAISICNRRIFDVSNSDEALSGMGTTITACLIVKDKCVVANVGDSRCYVLQNNELIQVTKDHSLVQQLVDNGTITEAEAYSHPNKNIITRALGTNENVDVDTFSIDINKTKKILLCTDGLSNVVKPTEMLDMINKYDNQKACEELVELSKAKGGRDNISVIVIEGEC